MKLTLDQIRAVTSGAEKVTEEGGIFKFFRFTESEMATTSNPNLLYPAGVRLDFITDGTCVSLSVRTREATGIRSYFAVDVLENTRLIGSIQNLSDADAVGNYANGVYNLGSFSGEFRLSDSQKQVSILLPHSVVAEISELEIGGATYIQPIKREKTLLVYGDSITQGYDALHPTDPYAVRLADSLGAELFNKGLGGAVFSPKLASAAGGHRPHAITVAYGSNDWKNRSAETLKNSASEFLSLISSRYPAVPIYVISPIWRRDADGVSAMGSFSDMEHIIKEVCNTAENVTFIKGSALVPPDPSLFGDGALHPSGVGFEYYFNGLRRVIK